MDPEARGFGVPVLPDDPKLEPQGVDRRTVLRLAGAGALAAVPFPLMSKVFGSQNEDRAEAPEVDYKKLGRIRQWAMVIDLRSCDGCQSVGRPPQCTIACIEGHFAPEPMQWIEIYEEEMQSGGTRFLPAPCMQCQNPPCVKVCPVAATFSTPEGVVLIDSGRCIGCRMCMAACPYDRRFFVWGDPPIPPEALLAKYDPEHQVPAIKGTVMKCDFCPDMLRAGKLPYCAMSCPNNAIYFGDLEADVATNGRDVVMLSDFLDDANTYRLKEEAGTHPRVYYISGHGEAVGRDPSDRGRLPTEWAWEEMAEGGVTWGR